QLPPTTDCCAGLSKRKPSRSRCRQLAHLADRTLAVVQASESLVHERTEANRFLADEPTLRQHAFPEQVDLPANRACRGDLDRAHRHAAHLLRKDLAREHVLNQTTV